MDINITCPQCGESVEATARGVCTKCGVNFKEFVAQLCQEAKAVKDNLDNIKKVKFLMLTHEDVIDATINKKVWQMVLTLGAIFAIIGFSSVMQVRGNLMTFVQELMEQKNLKALVQETAAKYTDEAIEESVKNRTDAVIIPIQEALEAKIENLNRLTSLYVLESQAREGSLDAYKKLINLSKESNDVGIAALAKLKAIREELVILRILPGLLMGSDIEIPVTDGKNGKLVSGNDADISLLVELIGYPGTNINVIQQKILFHLDRKFEKLDENERVRQLRHYLETTTNLRVAVSISAILCAYYDNKYDLFDFDGWLGYLKSK